MVTAVSSSSTASTVLSSASTTSSSSADVAALNAKIALKQSELAKTEDKDDAEALKSAIAELQAELKALQTTKTTSSTQTEAPAKPEGTKDIDEEKTLSGESERIGTKNFAEDTPFGSREMWL
ncbi:hypothetical protein [Agrobacterium rosae]|uniref:hypothetical protein n=1 Tax=Agrobacterium rosae TaxID=1972867 RepID=UPI003BA11810